MAPYDDRTQPIRVQRTAAQRGPEPAAAKPEPGPGAKAVGCLLLIALVLGGFWLVGTLLSGGDDAATQPATSGSSGAPAVDPETLYITTLNISGVPVTDTAAAVAAGRAVCAAFDEGLDATAFGVSFAESSGLSLEQTGTLMGAAVAAFCPEHRPVIESLPGAR